MAVKAKKSALRKVPFKEVSIFKIANRRGYAAVCRKNLTEGATVFQAYSRLVKACARNGLEIPERKASQLKG